jgi:hypothetical protein
VRERCRKVIDGVAQDGGYIMDASAIMQNDTNPENLRAMTEFTREYGVYSGAASPTPDVPALQPAGAAFPPARNPRATPGVCIPWEEKLEELSVISGDPDIAKRVWESIDALGNMYAWQCLLSF